MAPIRESTYFPPLDKCLGGRHQLLYVFREISWSLHTDTRCSSWKTTYTGLTQLENVPPDDSLERHLTDSQTIDLLKTSLLPSSPPTSHSQSTFQTKTSAINVVPSAQGRYNVKEIQDDTLWLSTKAAVDEVTALRIVILEWQTRPASQLKWSSSPDDTPAFGGSVNSSRFQPALSASRSKQWLSSLSNGINSTKPLYNEEARRRQLFTIYLEELRYKLETCNYLISLAVSITHNDQPVYSPASSFIPPWVQDIGRDILQSWNVDGIFRVTDKNVLTSGVDILRSRIRKLEEGCGWFTDNDSQEPMEVIWCESQILEMKAVLDIMLLTLTTLDRLSRADVVFSWFRLMSDYGFFEVFEPVSSTTSCLRA